MTERDTIYIIESEAAPLLQKKINQQTQIISLSDLFTFEEKFIHRIIFLDYNPAYIDKIKQILLVNPGIQFILYFQLTISPTILIDFVKAGVVETVGLNDVDKIAELTEKYAKNSSELQLNLLSNVTKKFREIGIITNNVKMAELLSQVIKVANADSTVLIHGESGTGKELIAKSIHYFSGRRNFKFVGVNAGAIPENLLEDELFGHVKGSFTSAIKDRKGKFEYAHHGSIFLDEISNTSIALQVKLLRVLQERVIEKLGDNESVPVDVRVIAATNQDIAELVREGKFREDLFYRLNVIPIQLPPLRQRQSDIPLLANFFILKYCQKNNVAVKSFSLPAIRLLKNYSWPGNIRQLENIIERMVVLNPDASLFVPTDIPDEIRPAMEDIPQANQFSEEIPDEGISLTDYIKNIEKKMILKSLEKTSWNKQKAADLLRIKRTTLIEKIKKIQE